MAAVGPTRQSRVSMSVSMSLVQGGAAGASAAGTVLGELQPHQTLVSPRTSLFVTFHARPQLLPLRIIRRPTSPRMSNRTGPSATALSESSGEFHFSKSC